MVMDVRENLVGGGHAHDVDFARHVGVGTEFSRHTWVPFTAAFLLTGSVAFLSVCRPHRCVLRRHRRLAGPSLKAPRPALSALLLIQQRLVLFVKGVCGPREQGGGTSPFRVSVRAKNRSRWAGILILNETQSPFNRQRLSNPGSAG